MRTARLVLSLLLPFFLSGCWQDQPINDRFLVFSLAVEPGRSGGDTLWTFQMPTPDYLEGFGNSGGGSSATGTPFFDIQVRDGTFSGAIVKAENRTSRDLYMGQLQTVFLSTDLPASRLRSFLDEEGRTGELDHTEFLLATAGSASKAMSTKMPQSPLPSFVVTEHFACPGCAEVRLDVPVYEAQSAVLEPTTDLALPLVEPSSHGYTIARVVIYRDLAKAAILSAKASRGWAWIANRIQKEAVNIPMGGGKASLRGLSGKTSYAIKGISRGRPYLDISIRGSAILSGLPPGVSRATPSVSKAIALGASKAVRDEVASAITEAKRVGSEPFGIGTRVRVMAPKVFESPASWREAFRRLPVRVSVHVSIEGTGSRL